MIIELNIGGPEASAFFERMSKKLIAIQKQNAIEEFKRMEQEVEDYLRKHGY